MLLAAYFGAQFVSDVPAALGVLIYLVPFLFVLTHSLEAFGKRDTLVTFLIIFVVSYAFEAVGTNTGFPFGAYSYPTAVNGPEILGVPPLLPLVYVAMGYACFWMARIILGKLRTFRRGDVFGVALLAAFMMVLWDLSIDPTASTVEGRYVWADGGPYFGVPFANFFGWLANAFTFFLLAGAYLASRRRRSAFGNDRFLLAAPLVLYAIAMLSAAKPLLVEGDVSGISQSMTLVAFFGMGFPLLAAALRLRQIGRRGT